MAEFYFDLEDRSRSIKRLFFPPLQSKELIKRFSDVSRIYNVYNKNDVSNENKFFSQVAIIEELIKDFANIFLFRLIES